MGDIFGHYVDGQESNRNAHRTSDNQQQEQLHMTALNILEGYASRNDLAASIGVTERTIARWTDQPDGLPVTKIGNKVLYRLDAAREWIASRERRRNPVARGWRNR